MGTISLDGIQLSSLATIPVEGGSVLHGIKVTDPEYTGFGEAYFSWIEPGFVKAWKRHKEITMNLIVPLGSVRFVFYDIERNCARVEIIGEDDYRRITVPPGIWFGFQGMSSANSLVCNIANLNHVPDEVERVGVQDIVFNWEKK
jgi:dTDP-4-dehydrorhamnose 3,5-epimerase